LRRITRVPRKRALFYSLLPGLGKRAAMLFLRRLGCGEAAAIGGAFWVAVRTSSA
jgi:hypothetical protein